MRFYDRICKHILNINKPCMITYTFIIAKIITDHWKTFVKIVLETLVIYLVIKFRYKSEKDIIKFPPKVTKRLIDEFEPDELVENVPDNPYLPNIYNENSIDLATYDIFNLKNDNKDEIIEIVKRYGVGTCGPRGFYGTLDLHLDLENDLKNYFSVEAAILYSNNFTAVNSVIACFAHTGDFIFYHQNSNEAIIRGVYLSRSKTSEYKSYEDLEEKLNLYTIPNRKSFVIIEGLCKNTGEILDIKRILELKKKYNFRIILDETFSIPILHPKGICGLNDINLSEIDIIIGSLAHGYSTLGAFALGSEYTVDYQRLSGLSYCFSASSPAALTKASILNLKKNFDYKKLVLLTSAFHKKFISRTYEIKSPVESPIIVLAKKEEFAKNKASYELMKEILTIKQDLEKNHIAIGFNHNPVPCIRICFKVNMEYDVVENVALLLRNI